MARRPRASATAADWCGGLDGCREHDRIAEDPVTRLPIECPVCGDMFAPTFRWRRPEPDLFNSDGGQ